MSRIIVPSVNIPRGLSVKDVSQKARVPRRPQHPFFVAHHPFVIQPFMIAPVLPGETLKNINMQSRCVSKPLKSRLVGWWLEHYIFYVPLTALDAYSMGTVGVGGEDSRSRMQNMLMDIQAPLIGAGPGAYSPSTYTAPDGFDFTSECLRAVTIYAFRHEGENAAISFGDGLQPDSPIASLKNLDITQSLFQRDELPAPDPVDVNATPSPDNWDIEEADAKYQTWLILSQQGLTNKSWEDYLADFGVQQPKKVKMGEVELIRMSNEWSYPTNTVEPSTGVPSSAMSWSINLRADKDRFFREPGFIFGVTIARPKTYRNDQKGSIAAHMISALDWMPAAFRERVDLSIRTFDRNTGPFHALYDAGSLPEDDGYILDMRDLFTYGDQYLNDLAADGRSQRMAVADGAQHLEHRYPVFAGANGVEGLFAGSTDESRLFEQDGLVSLNILGTQVDHTKG